MPSISHFYGLIIWLYWDESRSKHHCPHIHAEELMADWSLAINHNEVFKIRGLDA